MLSDTEHSRHDSPNLPEFDLDEGADALIESKEKKG